MASNLQLSRISRPAGDRRTGSGTILAGIRLAGLRPPEMRVDPRWGKAFPEQAGLVREWNAALLEWWRKVVAISDVGATSTQLDSIESSTSAAIASQAGSASASTPEPTPPSASSSSGSASSESMLIQWTTEEAYRMISVVMNATGHVQSATVRWPDGSGGVFTTLSFSSEHKAIDSFQITHVQSGRRVFQPKIVRDSGGNPIQLPDLKLI